MGNVGSQLSLTYLTDMPGSFDDMVFRLGDFEHVCDSYYYCFDHNYSDCYKDDDNEERCAKTSREVIALLLDQWIEHIEQLEDGDCIYLPFDFSDQCTGCLRVRRNGEEYELTPGWSLIEGHAHFPSNIRKFVQAVGDFDPMLQRPVMLGRGPLLRDLEDSKYRAQP